MPRQRISTCDFDPFEFTWLYRGLKNVHTARLVVISIIMTVLLFVVNYIDGTMGSIHDSQLVADLRRVLGLPNVAPSAPNFPFLRDTTSWFLAFTIMSGSLLLHRQWQHMSRCLSTLAGNGALVAKSAIGSNWLSRILLIDRIVAGASPEQALDVFVRRVVRRLSKMSVVLLVLMIASSIVLAYLLVLGQERALFQVFAPKGLSPSSRQAWLDMAYRSWWAGTYHVFGHLLYLIYAIFAIFIILSFQVIGLIAIYVTIAIYFLAEPSADWLNRDGRFGWMPLARVFRTVIWGNTLLGATLTVTIVSLGANNYDWILGLLVLYVIMVPLFVTVPWVVFRRVEERARVARISEINQIIADRSLDVDRDIEALAPLIVEIDRCRGARIRPLRLRSASFSTFAILVVLPVILAAAQIYFQIESSGK